MAKTRPGTALKFVGLMLITYVIVSLARRVAFEVDWAAAFLWKVYTIPLALTLMTAVALYVAERRSSRNT
jgi:hypothetical protein